MIIKPGSGEYLWDSWIFEWEGEYHLFYLASGGDYCGIAHAVGRDLVNWTRVPGLTMAYHPYTGMVLRHGDRFLMVIGECIDSVQTVVLYESDDLVTWRRVCDPPVLRPTGPHYLDRPNEWRPQVPWRDPFIFQRPGCDGYEVIICAGTPNHGPDHSGAVIGRARTRDFRAWDVLPPLNAPTGTFYHNEVPEYFEMAGRHYILFSSGSCYGLRVDTPSRHETVGTYYLVADRFDGPYVRPDECMLVGAGQGRMGPYVGRTIKYGDERLLYHHTRNDSGGWTGTWAAPKRLLAGADGLLHLEYWPGLAAMESGEDVALRHAAEGGEIGEWEWQGDALQGRSNAMGASFPAVEHAGDVHVQCALTSWGAARGGIVLRAGPQGGVAVNLDFERGQVEIGLAVCHPVAGWGRDVTGFAPGGGSEQSRRLGMVDSVRTDLEHGRPYHLRCLVRDVHVEVYLDERWLFTVMLSEAPLEGGIALTAERGAVRFEGFQAATLTPMPTLSAPA